MVLAHLHLNMARMRAVLYRCTNVAWPDLDLPQPRSGAVSLARRFNANGIKITVNH